ncbi:unnamed protein product [Cuscuta epithymum]|uniref:RRM domain-containing protein n=1 Tax=Cuscuta epithymum TaxID=186058 RepID=A0AAV0E0Z2_9ASTE|nr:unnamed protein product [Cuscuta epithymum]CAH9147329.1 unnamed protein product [Cuscuta epithymum]
MVADASLDMSLDDLIKKNRNSGGGNFRGRGRGAVPGPVRRNSNRPASRSAPYSTPKDVAWDHDMFVAAQPIPFPGQFSGGGGRASSIETGTKLYISNLEYGVSNEDIKELFAEVGDLKRYSIHYDRSGRSKGTAEVVFSRRQDAISAVKRYNNVQLDGKPMKIEMVGTNIVTPPPVQPAFGGAFGAFSVIPRSGPGRRKYLRKTLTQSWRSTIRNRCKKIDPFPDIISLFLYSLCNYCANLYLMNSSSFLEPFRLIDSFPFKCLCTLALIIN